MRPNVSTLQTIAYFSSLSSLYLACSRDAETYNQYKSTITIHMNQMKVASRLLF